MPDEFQEALDKIFAADSELYNLARVRASHRLW